MKEPWDMATTLIPTEILSFDGSGFDASRVTAPTVVEVGGEYQLLFAGLPFFNNFQIGLAASADGVDWQKFSNSPVISNSSSPTPFQFRIIPNTVLFEDGIYKLWFSGNNINNQQSSSNIRGIGFATSLDGVNWEFREEPILTESGGGQGFVLIEMVRLGSGFVAYYRDLNPSDPRSVLLTATSSDGVTFSEGSPLTLPDGMDLATATTGASGGVEALLRGDDDRYYRATSANGETFSIVEEIVFESTFTPQDIVVEDGRILYFGTTAVGNVNWNFGNSVIAMAEFPTSTSTDQRTLIFSDDFNRSDSTEIGNEWTVVAEGLNEGLGSDGFLLGTSTLDIIDNQLAATFTQNSAGGPRDSRFIQPFLHHDLGADLSDTGFEVSATFTPGNDAQVVHFIGLIDADAGTTSRSAGGQVFTDPLNGIGISLQRSDDRGATSRIILQTFEDGVRTDHRTEFTSLQYDSGELVRATLRFEADGAYEMMVNDGTGSEVFSGSIDPVDFPLTDVAIFSQDQSLAFFGDSTEVVTFDDVEVFALGEVSEPEPPLIPPSFREYTWMALDAYDYRQNPIFQNSEEVVPPDFLGEFPSENWVQKPGGIFAASRGASVSTTDGFDANIYSNSDTSQIVIAIRGTEFGYALDPDVGGLTLTNLALGLVDTNNVFVRDFLTLFGYHDNLEGSAYAQLLESFTGSAVSVAFGPLIDAALEDLVPLGREILISQAESAIRLVLETARDNPEFAVSVTGHSLGGALSAYVAAALGVSAITFDPAPYGSGNLLNELRQSAQEIALDLGLTEADLADLGFDLDSTPVRNAFDNVEIHRLSGSIVEELYFDAAPIVNPENETVVSLPYDGSSAPFGLGSVELHSMDLHALAFDSSKRQDRTNFEDLAVALPSLSAKITDDDVVGVEPVGDDFTPFLRTLLIDDDLYQLFEDTMLYIDALESDDDQEEFYVESALKQLAGFAEADFISFFATPGVIVGDDFGTSDSSDVVRGTDGDDNIRTFAGAYDRSAGGAGADTFIFGGESNNERRERDLITDFDIFEDTILLVGSAEIDTIRDLWGRVIIRLEDDGDIIDVRGDGVSSESISILTDDDILVS